MTNHNPIAPDALQSLIHAFEELQESHRAAGDDYVAAQWGKAARMADKLMPTLPEPVGHTSAGNPVFDADTYRFTADLESGEILMSFIDDHGPEVHVIPDPQGMVRALAAAYYAKENHND